MTLSAPAQVLFEIIDTNLDRSARSIRNQVFSAYRDMPWTPEQREIIQPLIRKELDQLIWSILGALTNVGAVLPDDADGYLICTMEDRADIGDGYTDYSDMWLEYLAEKQDHENRTGPGI